MFIITLINFFTAMIGYFCMLTGKTLFLRHGGLILFLLGVAGNMCSVLYLVL